MGKPTVIGSAVAISAPVSTGSTQMTIAGNTGAIVLQEAQLPEAEKRLAALDFERVSSGDIITIGLKAEQNLSSTLDGFMARLNQTDAGQTFDLFTRVQKGVDDAKLPEIVEKIKNPPEPSLWARFTGMFRGKSAADLRRDIFREVSNLITGRTKTLADLLSRMENEIRGKMQGLFTELQVQERLKHTYSDHFNEFAVEAAVARAFLENAKLYVAEEEAKLAANPTDVQAQARVQELRTKLALLESRALALEGTYTRLPADQMVIQQIEQAGVSTLQETATTMNQRFASIKMTLLSINGAFQVQGVQMLSERSAAMDRQLLDVRGQLIKQVAGTAAAAPGNNRLAQAEQVEAVIRQIAEVNDIVKAARSQSEQKMSEARAKFGNARQELARLASGK